MSDSSHLRNHQLIVKVPSSLLAALDEQCAADGETRSVIVRRLLRQGLRGAQETR